MRTFNKTTRNENTTAQMIEGEIEAQDIKTADKIHEAQQNISMTAWALDPGHILATKAEKKYARDAGIYYAKALTTKEHIAEMKEMTDDALYETLTTLKRNTNES